MGWDTVGADLIGRAHCWRTRCPAQDLDILPVCVTRTGSRAKNKHDQLLLYVNVGGLERVTAGVAGPFRVITTSPGLTGFGDPF
jgi:hypothetical protein